MNPYAEQRRSARRKRIEWMNNGEVGPDIYFGAELRAMRKFRAWDANRPFVIRTTNNPLIPEIHVPVAPDLKFVLHPRVRLLYDFVSLAPPHIVTDPLEGRGDLVASVFASRKVHVDKIDMKSTLLYKNPPDNRGARLVAKVTVFIRDLSFISPRKVCDEPDLCNRIKIASRFLLKQKFARFPMVLLFHKFEMIASLPVSEDPDQLLAQFSALHPGYMEHTRPLIILRNLVSKWFVQPNSCEPTQELLSAFFSYFGQIRYIEVSKDELNEELCTASVEYLLHDDFLYALRTLCCCSLREEHSPLLVDYEVGLGTMPVGLELAFEQKVKISRNDSTDDRMFECKSDQTAPSAHQLFH